MSRPRSDDLQTCLNRAVYCEHASDVVARMAQCSDPVRENLRSVTAPETKSWHRAYGKLLLIRQAQTIRDPPEGQYRNRQPNFAQRMAEAASRWHCVPVRRLLDLPDSIRSLFGQVPDKGIDEFIDCQWIIRV